MADAHDRALAAYTDVLAVEHDTDAGVMRILTLSECYTAIPETGQHLCPDKEYHEPPRCKHEYAADATRDQTDVPTGWLVVEDLDDREGNTLPDFEHFEPEVEYV
jgi:hypothetical protein